MMVLALSGCSVRQLDSPGCPRCCRRRDLPFRGGAAGQSQPFAQ